MENDFNTTYKNYLNYSKVYKNICEQIKKDDSYTQAALPTRIEYCKAMKAVMQLVITDPSCLQNANFKNNDIVCLLKENNSKDIQEHYTENYQHKLDQDGYFIKALVSVLFSKNAHAVTKGTESCLVEAILKEKENYQPDFNEANTPKKVKVKV